MKKLIIGLMLLPLTMKAQKVDSPKHKEEAPQQPTARVHTVVLQDELWQYLFEMIGVCPENVKSPVSVNEMKLIIEQALKNPPKPAEPKKDSITEKQKPKKHGK